MDDNTNRGAGTPGVAATPDSGPCANWGSEAALIRSVVDRVGDKWSVLVIATLGEGQRRYSDLHAAVPGISQRMLTLTLKQLTRDGLISRTAYAEVPPRVEYGLTDLGCSLLHHVSALAEWAQANSDRIHHNRATYDDASG